MASPPCDSMDWSLQRLATAAAPSALASLHAKWVLTPAGVGSGTSATPRATVRTMCRHYPQRHPEPIIFHFSMSAPFLDWNGNATAYTMCGW